MEKIEVVKLDKKGICIDIRSMTLNQWHSFKRNPSYIYRAFQKKYHAFKIGQ